MKVILIILCVIGGLFVIGALVVIWILLLVKDTDYEKICENCPEIKFTDDEGNEYIY